MCVTPILLAVQGNAPGLVSHAPTDTSTVPNISEIGKTYRGSAQVPVHDRLYRHAIQKSAEQHNQMVRQSLNVCP